MEPSKKPGQSPLDDDMANELEILRLMKKYQSDSASQQQEAACSRTDPSNAADPAAAAESSAPDEPDQTPLVPPTRRYDPPAAEIPVSTGAPLDETAGAEAAAVKRKPAEVLLAALGNVIPKKGDAPLEIVRKCVFLVALLVLIGSVSYIINEMVVVPTVNKGLYDSLGEQYDPDNPPPLKDEYKDYTGYPEGIDDAFKNLYPLNTDLRGWITYSTVEGTNDFLRINYPVMYTGENNADNTYLTTDFNKNPNKNGALFFDERNHIETPDDYNKVTIIYGHNMASGQMFSGLNKFIGNVNNVRAAPVITMNTLFHRNQYKVFAVVMIDDEAPNDRYAFSYLRAQFSDDTDFLNYVNELRAHSMFDYNSVDVRADDELLVLSTCTNSNPLKEGRLGVIARRVRDGESATVDTSKILKNDDVIMPRAWYEKRGEALHPFYTDPNYTIPTVTTTTQPGWTNPSEDSRTDPSDGTTTTTTRGGGSSAGTTSTTKSTTNGPTSGQGTQPGTNPSTTTTTTTTTTTAASTPTQAPPVTDTTTAASETTTSAATDAPTEAPTEAPTQAPTDPPQEPDPSAQEGDPSAAA